MGKKKGTKKKPTAKFIREVDIRYKMKRIRSDSKIDEPLTDPEAVVDIFRDLQSEAKEKMLAVAVDSKLKLMSFEVVAVGSISAIYARPGECSRTAIIMNANGFMVVHNHPSGDPTPSQEDKEFTWHLVMTGQSTGIPLFDHIIIGAETYFSFSNTGLIAKYLKSVHKQLGKNLPKD